MYKIIIEIYLNIIHYCIFKFLNRLSIAIDKINPLMLLGKIPCIKRGHEKHNTSLTKIMNDIYLDEYSGYNIMYSNAAVGMIIFVNFYFITLFLNNLIGLSNFITWSNIFYFSIIPSYLIFHFTISKNDKYILYFRKFDKKSKQTKREYAFLSLLFIVLTILSFILSFQYVG